MTPELTALALAGLLQVLHFCAYSLTACRQVGVRTALGNRDEKIELTGTAGRLGRAMNNHFEALVLFTIAVVTITYADKSSSLTALLCAIYLIARALYLPAYALGLVPWRSILWFVGLLATVALLLLALT